MVYNKNNKGQAAIEFLMTYGWMLLVVLIVGALIFSFVDFGSLLPNKVELNNNIVAAQSESFARVVAASPAITSHAVVTFTYQGTKRVTISDQDSQSKIVSLLDGECDLVWIKNADTDEATDDGTLLTALTTSGYSATISSTAPEVNFISGQTGVAIYNCSTITANGFRQDDVLEGKVNLIFRNALTDVPVPSTGDIRMVISET